jgi:hypothetical protein
MSHTFSTVRTATREYRLVGSSTTGLWSASYRVLNPKTGQAWQGIKQAKELTGTHYRYLNYHTSYISPLHEGKATWDGAPEGTTSLAIGYLTEEALTRAIEEIGK